MLVKQEKYVSMLKSKISKLEKQITIKDEEITEKENNILELNERISELNLEIENLKSIFKIQEKTKFFQKNEEISNLKNEMEIHLKKMEFSDKKFKNLQDKYIRLLKDKKQLEHNNLILSFDNKLKKSENRISKNVLNSIPKLSMGKQDDEEKDKDEISVKNNNLITISYKNTIEKSKNFPNNFNELKSVRGGHQRKNNMTNKSINVKGVLPKLSEKNIYANNSNKSKLKASESVTNNNKNIKNLKKSMSDDN